jgi:hypothetical protein
MVDLREKIDDAVRVVAGRENLTAGHGVNTFKRMTRQVFEQVQPAIDQAVDQRVDERVSAERTRITTILDAPEAAGREVTARRLALDSDMDATKAIAILASTPLAQTGPTPLALAMANEDNAVNADDGSDAYASMSEEERLADSIINSEETGT